MGALPYHEPHLLKQLEIGEIQNGFPIPYFVTMLPRSAIPCIADIARASRNHEEQEESALELEEISSSKNVRKRPPSTPAEFLLGPEFHRKIPKPLAMNKGLENCETNQGISPDWTLRPLPRDVLEKVESLQSMVIYLPATRKSVKEIELTGTDLDRLRGARVLSWLSDQEIDSFTGLINDRSRRAMEFDDWVPDKPSKVRDIFKRRRVRAHIFSTNVFSVF